MTMLLLEWVFTSVFLILVVLALRAALGRRIGAGLRYALWAVVLMRLLVPVQLFTSPIAGTWVITEGRTEQHVYTPANRGENALPQPDGPTAVLDTAPSADEPVLTAPEAPTLPDAPRVPEAPIAPDLTQAPAWLGWTWLTGSAVMALVLLGSNLRFARRLRRCRIPMEGVDCPLPVYAAVGLPSPCLLGVVRPAVYVTPETAADPAMLRHVIAHELTHYRHLDHVWNVLRCAALAAHWWNPLVWASVVLSRRDGELACDEGALKRLGDGERAAYGSTLLALVTAKPRPGDLLCFATTMAGDKKSLKERITCIAAAPKRWMWAVVAVVLVTVLACACAFGQKAEEEAGDPDPDPAPTQSAAPEARNMDVEVEIAFSHAGIDDPTSSFYVPEDVLERAQLWVADQFAWDAPGGVMTGAWKEYNKDTDEWETHGDPDSRAYFDRVRISSMGGPQSYTVRAVEYSLWSINYEYHTTTPEVVKVGKFLHMGPGRYMDQEGWMGMYYPSSTYLIFRHNAHGTSTYAGVIQSLGEDGNPAFPSQEQVEAALYPEPERGAPPEGAFDHPRTVALYNPDLNRNGVRETVVTADMGDGEGGVMGQYVGVFEDDQLIWWDEGYYAHAGWNAIFACTMNNQDYLLRYNPVMYQGMCSYSYKLFTLENGRETAVEEAGLDFDINVGMPNFAGPFDPDAISTFMAKVNHLLAWSRVLMVTDEDLRGTIERNDGLVDDLWWLDIWEPVFVRDENLPLLGNLVGFLAAMEPYGVPTVRTLYEGEQYRLQLSYHGQQAQFDGYWDQWFDPLPTVQAVDLNGDGKDEIVVILNEGHGTGVNVYELYIFDADTLRQYDTSTLTQDIIGQIRCTGDKDNFYLSAPGMERVTISRDIFGGVPYLADEISLGNIVYYNLGEDGRLSCTLGCDASGTTNLYCGSLYVGLDFDGSALRVSGCDFEMEEEYAPSPFDPYRPVLLGEGAFTLVVGGRAAQTRKTLAGFTAVKEFAMVRTEDGGTAVVLKTVYANSGSEGLMLLSQKDGVVYGTEVVYSGLGEVYARAYDVKVDGTLVIHDSPGMDGEVASIDTEQVSFRVITRHNEGADAEYYADGQPTDEAGYRAALERAAAKKDAFWYKFREDTIHKVFS